MIEEEKDYRLEAYIAIEDERDRQVKLWGDEPSMISERGTHDYLKTKMVVLMEEVGELAKEILDGKNKESLEEAVQVAAVAKAIVEGLKLINAS